MFKLFKKKTELEKLEIEYRKLLEESFNLSKSDRKLSDSKYVEANKIMEKIELLKAKN